MYAINMEGKIKEMLERDDTPKSERKKQRSPQKNGMDIALSICYNSVLSGIVLDCQRSSAGRAADS